MSAPDREHDVRLPSHVARVLEWGPPDGPLVVALHGFPDTAYGWRKVAPLLAASGWATAPARPDFAERQRLARRAGLVVRGSPVEWCRRVTVPD